MACRDCLDHSAVRVPYRAHRARPGGGPAPADGDYAVAAAHGDRRAHRPVLRLADHHGDGGRRGLAEAPGHPSGPVVRLPRRRHRDAGWHDLPGHIGGAGAERLAAWSVVRAAGHTAVGPPDASLLADHPDTRSSWPDPPPARRPAVGADLPGGTVPAGSLAPA